MMKRSHHATDSNLIRLLPSLHDLLQTPGFAALLETEPRTSVVHATREVLSRMQQEIAEGRHTQATLESELAFVHATVAEEIARTSRYSLRRVINATGVVLHTNLGRAPLSASALRHILETAGGYSNLELDLETGERSRRDVHAENLRLRAMGGDSTEAPSYAALVVNNCAAATFLALNTLAEGRRSGCFSRGIGRDRRRVPYPRDSRQVGRDPAEVGTTNRTRLADYEDALTAGTRLILRVHQSNFSMEGFTERPALRDLISLGKRCNVPVFNDQGTGLITSLEPLGIASEPTLLDSFHLGCDLIAASGDKLLGGPQCGLLIGKADLVQKSVRILCTGRFVPTSLLTRRSRQHSRTMFAEKI